MPLSELFILNNDHHEQMTSSKKTSIRYDPYSHPSTSTWIESTPNAVNKQSKSNNKKTLTDYGKYDPNMPLAVKELSKYQYGSVPCFWYFLLKLLVDSTMMNVVRWTGRGKEFRILSVESLTQMWGATRASPVNEESLLRLVRSCYRYGIIIPVNARDRRYAFVTEPSVHVDMSSVDLDQYIAHHNTDEQAIVAGASVRTESHIPSTVTPTSYHTQCDNLQYSSSTQQTPPLVYTSPNFVPYPSPNFTPIASFVYPYDLQTPPPSCKYAPTTSSSSYNSNPIQYQPYDLSSVCMPVTTIDPIYFNHFSPVSSPSFIAPTVTPPAYPESPFPVTTVTPSSFPVSTVTSSTYPSPIGFHDEYIPTYPLYN